MASTAFFAGTIDDDNNISGFICDINWDFTGARDRAKEDISFTLRLESELKVFRITFRKDAFSEFALKGILIDDILKSKIVEKEKMEIKILCPAHGKEEVIELPESYNTEKFSGHVLCAGESYQKLLEIQLEFGELTSVRDATL